MTNARNRVILITESERKVIQMDNMIDFLLSLDNDNVVKKYDIIPYSKDISTVIFYCEDNGEKFTKKFYVMS